MKKQPLRGSPTRRRKQAGWISFELPQDMLEHIKELARKRGVTYQRVIKDAVIEALAIAPEQST